MSPTTFAKLIESGILEIGDGYRAKNSELGGEGPIFLRAGHVSDTHIDFVGAERFLAELEDRVRSKMSEVGDTIITTKGNSTGRTSFVTPSMPPFVYSPHLSYWRSKDAESLDPNFIRYWSRSPEFIRQLNGMKVSTDMAPYLSLTDQRRLEITLPAIEVQRHSGALLSSLDEKVEINRRMNAVLEEMARAIFRAWFVDFEPVKAKAAGATSFPGMPQETFDPLPNRLVASELGEIPEGWTVGKLGDVCKNVRQAVRPEEIDPDTPYIGLEHMPRRSIGLSAWGTAAKITSNKSEFQKHDVLFGKLRPYFHKVGVAAVSGVCSTDILVLRPPHGDWFGFVLGHASSDSLIQYADRSSAGTKMPRTNWKDLSAYEIVRPPVEFAALFSRLVGPMVRVIQSNIHEITSISATRDALLPKLISGELTVPAARALAAAS